MFEVTAILVAELIGSKTIVGALTSATVKFSVVASVMPA